MKVIILSKNETVGTVEVVDGRAVFSTAAARAYCDRRFVPEPGNPKRRLSPADGDEWLRALAETFVGAYVGARIEETP